MASEKYDSRFYETGRIIYAVFAMLLYAVGMNLFIVPCGLYSGGILGISQLLRTLLESLGLNFGGFDYSGIIYYIINIPIFILAFKTLGKFFAVKTIICVSAMSLFLSVIPVIPVMEGDTLASCLIGGILTGLGTGLSLRMGASAGGIDIIGLYFVKTRGTGVGRVSLLLNIVIYSVCLFMFNVQIAVYSLIFAAIASFATDKTHLQNIDMQATVISQTDTTAMRREILDTMVRGITEWRAEGAYTGAPCEVLFIVLSKYEVGRLKRIVHNHDPKAFIVITEGASVDGHYLKKL